MKYLIGYNLFESVIIPDMEPIISVGNDLSDFLQKNRRISIKDANIIGNKYNIEFVDYDAFFNELSEEDKKTAPPKGDRRMPFFALINPITENPRIVCQKPIEMMDINHIEDILYHEFVHVGQHNKRKIKFPLPDPTKTKEYFSNKDEIMAFSKSIVDMLINHQRINSIKDGIKELKYNPLYGEIKRTVDKKILDRYHKYIYQYLKNKFESNN